MYIVKKNIHGKTYYYLRESRREGKKIISKNIAYFGKNKPSEQEIKAKIAQIRGKQVVPIKENDVVAKETKEVVPKKEHKEEHKKPMEINDFAVFCKKKGFVYPNSEIYGGFAGFFDFGHLGTELKNNIKQQWWKTFVQQREDVAGIDGTTISNPKVWVASGHAAGFTDYVYACEKCRSFAKGDDDKGMKCPRCGAQLENPSKFNLMFSTQVGPAAKEENTAYLRPETAQQMFTNFKLVVDNARMKLPFGIAQIGRAYRNEISPRDFLFRSREFEQMEIEYFVHPDKINDCPCINEIENLKINIVTAEMQIKKENHIETTIKELINKNLATPWHAYWLGLICKWFLELGIKPENLRIREHLKEELAHYAKACFDIEYRFPFGWKEIHGNADRQQFDLNQHIKHSKVDLSLYDEEKKQRIVPYVASEPSQGLDRAFLAFLVDAYNDDKERGNIVLKLHPKLAPVKVGVFPLVNKLDEEAREVFELLKEDFVCQFDRSRSIGRRYARADEIGIPCCITVDFDTLKDNAVTIRNRDDTKQVRVKIKELKEKLNGLLIKQSFLN